MIYVLFFGCRGVLLSLLWLCFWHMQHVICDMVLTIYCVVLWLQGCTAEFALAALLAYAVTDGSEQMSHSASVGAIVLVC